MEKEGDILVEVLLLKGQPRLMREDIYFLVKEKFAHFECKSIYGLNNQLWGTVVGKNNYKMYLFDENYNYKGEIDKEFDLSKCVEVERFVLYEGKINDLLEQIRVDYELIDELDRNNIDIYNDFLYNKCDLKKQIYNLECVMSDIYEDIFDKTLLDNFYVAICSEIENFLAGIDKNL